MQEQFFGSGNGFRKLPTNPRDALRIAKMIEYLISQDKSTEPPPLSGNVVSLDRHRKRMERAVVVSDTIFMLSEVVGRKTAILLYIVGFKTLSDVASASPIALSSLPNIGPVRFKKIYDFLAAKGYNIKSIGPIDSGYSSIRDSFQLELDFAEFLDDVTCSDGESL